MNFKGKQLNKSVLARKENEWGNKKQRNQDRQPTLQTFSYAIDQIGRDRARHK